MLSDERIEAIDFLIRMSLNEDTTPKKARPFIFFLSTLSDLQTFSMELQLSTPEYMR